MLVLEGEHGSTAPSPIERRCWMTPERASVGVAAGKATKERRSVDHPEDQR
jgi:hypothetical protein